MGELAALPETALVSRLGQQGRRLQLLARGEADHLLVPEEPEFTLSETTALDNPLTLLDSLLFVLSPMLESILRKAMDRAYALRSIRMTLRLERGEPHSLEIRPVTPTQNRELLLKLLNLELQAHPPQAGIVSVRLDAEPAQPQTAQRGLFQAQFPEPNKLELLLARLRSIAGPGNVGYPGCSTAMATMLSPWHRSSPVFVLKPNARESFHVLFFACSGHRSLCASPAGPINPTSCSGRALAW